MPVYHVKDPQTGLEMDLRGDSPPTEAELTQIFDTLSKQQRKPPQPQMRSRTGGFYTPPTDSGMSDFVSGVGSAVNPMTYLSMAQRAVTDPIGLVKDVVMSPVNIAGGMITQPARTLGNLTGGLALGGLVKAAPSAAQGVMDSPVAQNVALRTLKPGATGLGAAVGGPGGAIVGSALGDELVAALRSKLQGRQEPTGPMPRIAGKSPSVEDALNYALQDILNEKQTMTTSTPPPPSQTATGRPSVTAQRYDQMQQQASGAAPSASRAPMPKSAKMAETDAGADKLSALLDAIHGEDRPTVGNGVLPANTPRPSLPPQSIRLTPAEVQMKDALMKQGYSETDVIRTIIAQRLKQSPSFAKLPG